MMSKQIISPRRSRGLTVTESVTALAMLAIGVLCIATLYEERNQAAPAVLVHSKASRLANELASSVKEFRNESVRFENPVGTICKPSARSESKQRVADMAVACWQEKIAQNLPSGTGAITLDASSVSPTYLITVSWLSAGNGTASYLLRTEAPEGLARPPSKPAPASTKSKPTSASEKSLQSPTRARTAVGDEKSATAPAPAPKEPQANPENDPNVPE